MRLLSRAGTVEVSDRRAPAAPQHPPAGPSCGAASPIHWISSTAGGPPHHRRRGSRHTNPKRKGAVAPAFRAEGAMKRICLQHFTFRSQSPKYSPARVEMADWKRHSGTPGTFRAPTVVPRPELSGRGVPRAKGKYAPPCECAARPDGCRKASVKGSRYGVAGARPAATWRGATSFS